jgi:endonuclease YncB( thermonuclease family)
MVVVSDGEEGGLASGNSHRFELFAGGRATSRTGHRELRCGRRHAGRPTWDGQIVRVRVVGIDTPEGRECGTDEATALMQQLALGRSVSLTADPTQEEVDRFGRSLFYVDRDDGADLGEEMIRAGRAAVYFFDQPFERLAQYRDTADEAEDFERGVGAVRRAIPPVSGIRAASGS